MTLALAMYILFLQRPSTPHGALGNCPSRYTIFVSQHTTAIEKSARHSHTTEGGYSTIAAAKSPYLHC